jgi:hypothetical protein
MNHADAFGRLEEYFDGSLPPGVHRDIEAHLGSCPACREELTSLGALLDTVARLRGREVEPERDLWPGIATRMANRDDQGSARSGARGQSAEPDLSSLTGVTDMTDVTDRRESTGVTGASARTIGIAGTTLTSGRSRDFLARTSSGRLRRSLVFGTAGLAAAAAALWLLWPKAEVTSTAEVPPGGVVAGELAALDQEVKSARQSIHPDSAPATALGSATEAAPGTATAAAPADTAATGATWRDFDQGLEVLDAALRESRAALARDPGNPVLQKSVLAAYQKQLELIRWANRVVRQS